MDLRIEIAGNRVTCLQDKRAAFSVPLGDFLAQLVERSGSDAFPEAIPTSVRFIKRKGQTVVLAMEQPPMVHSVRWLEEGSSAGFGKGASYRLVELAFPFIVLIVAFRAGELTGQQQCFYRCAPLRNGGDPLFYPNLFNVAKGYGQACWLCLANMEQSLAPFSWEEKVRHIWNHLFGAGFNASSEHHEGMSYWGAMRDIDPRVANVSSWEQASRTDPLFPLQVAWRPLGRSIGEVMEEMLVSVVGHGSPDSAKGLVQVLNEVRAGKRSRWSFLSK